MKKKSYLLILIFIGMFPVFASGNVTQDNEKLLLTSCQTLTTTPGHKDAKHCVHYIQGFLAAAQALKHLVTNKKSDKSRKPQGFMSRAYHQPMGYKPKPSSLLFCIPSNESETNIINAISEQLPTQEYTKQMLGDILITAFKSKYPCENT